MVTKERSFLAKIQKQRRVVIPKKDFEVMDLDIGGTVEVSVEKIEKEE